MRAALIALPLFLLAACAQPAPAPDPEADKAAIEETAMAWLAAYEAQDLDAMMAIYTPDSFVALNDQPAMRGVEEIRAYFEKNFAGAQGKMTLDIEQIVVNGDVGWLTSLFRLDLTLKHNGQTLSFTGRSLLLYDRQADGSWLMRADIDNVTPDADVLKAME